MEQDDTRQDSAGSLLLNGAAPNGSSDMRVIGAGFGRTGTMSLKAALEMLGFGPCSHMIEAASRPDRAQMWLDASEGRPVDWSVVLRGFRSTVDWPSCAFYRELMDAFPTAQVVLTVRDPERWYNSVSETIFRRPSAGPPGPSDDIATRMIRSVIWQGTMHGKFTDRETAIAIFNRHIDEVRATVPPERLLIFEVKQGWQPLCEFLGVPKPADVFPHINERDTFNDSQAFDRLVEAHRSSVV